MPPADRGAAAELRRDRELATRKGTKLWDTLIETFDKIRRGFEDQGTRADQILDNWDCYNCITGQNQSYNGNAQYYVPIVRNAVNARKTRFVNQIFPSSGRYIDAASDDGSLPGAVLALLEHYVRKTRLRTEIMMALCRNGDLEGQYNLYVDWNSTTRHVVSRETKPAKVSVPGIGPVDHEDEQVDQIVEEDVEDQAPAVEAIHDTDVLVRPATADSIEKALAQGGDVTIIRRWTKDTLREKIASGEVVERYASLILNQKGWTEDDSRSVGREQVDAAGIKGKGEYILVYETWKLLSVGDGKRLCRSWYGGYNLVLSCRLNPFWNDRCPLISVPVDKVAGSFKGSAPVEAVKSIQYHATDVANQAADSATYSMLPIIMTDPVKNPRTSTMMLNLAAIWECDPNSTRFAEFPKLWQDGIALIQADTQLAFMTLGVNPAMLPQQTGKPGAKRNQAEVALETTVDLLTTNEACSVLEEGILTPLVERFAEYDSQFRDDDVTVRAYGELGIEAKMERIRPRQIGARYTFTWFGVEQARNAAQMQQQIALLNVARGFLPLLQQAGYQMNPAPVFEAAFGNVFGWRLARQVLKDARQQLSVDPALENAMLEDGFSVEVHAMDDDPRHLAAHQQAMAGGDPAGMIRIHMQKHMQAMQLKQAAMMQRAIAQQTGAQPGQQSQGAGPGMPQAGAQPAGPRLIKGPPGQIPPEAMPRAGNASAMPRRY